MDILRNDLAKCDIITSVGVLYKLRSIYKHIAESTNDIEMYNDLNKKLKDISPIILISLKKILLVAKFNNINESGNIIKFEFNISYNNNDNNDKNECTFFCKYYINDDIIEVYKYDEKKNIIRTKIYEIKEKNVFNSFFKDGVL